ncbi:MAG: hypothetical protein LBI60_02250 [Bacteroidales bacterium]|jgi:predicted tellurium resistance membrane protein TerC|nr:hypothetical protein [Bacteroidales bacterium]
MMEIIIYIVIALVILFVAYAFLSALLKKFPILLWILSVVVGAIVWLGTGAWWGGLIAAIISYGIFATVQGDGGNQCAHCNSYDTYVIQDDRLVKSWQCNKCNGITYEKK